MDLLLYEPLVNVLRITWYLVNSNNGGCVCCLSKIYGKYCLLHIVLYFQPSPCLLVRRSHECLTIVKMCNALCFIYQVHF